MTHHSGMFRKGFDPRRFDLVVMNRSRCGIPRNPLNKQKISDGRKDKEKREMYRDIIEWLVANIVEPELIINEDQSNTDKVKIWFMILNYGHVNSVENPNYRERIVKFISYIQDYLPDCFHNKELYKKQIRDEKLCSIFEHWFFECKQKIQNHLTQEYYIKGRLKDLEILKRRYKENWSESKVVDLTADANMKVDSDTKLEIKIMDA